MLNASTSPGQIGSFVTTLDMKQGTLSWQFDWCPGYEHCGNKFYEQAGAGTNLQPTMLQIEYEMFVHKLYVNQAAVRLSLKSRSDINVTVIDVIDGRSSVRTEHVAKSYGEESSTIWSAVSPKNVDNVTAYVVSTLESDQNKKVRKRSNIVDKFFGSTHESSVSQYVDIELINNEWSEVSKYVGVASSDAFDDPKATALSASAAGAAAGYNNLRRSHSKEWESIMTDDSVDTFSYVNSTGQELIELARSSVANPFMLLQNTVGPNAIAAANHNTRLNVNSIPVCGIGSDCYGGLIFWDAEVWMALGLQVSHPQHIESVVNYRVAMYPQAKENVKTAFASSKNQTGRFTGGAVYPWTSGRHGNCTASGPCFDYQYHVNGAIAIAFRNHFIATGDSKMFKEQFLPISNDIAYFYGELVDFNETSGYYEINNATDPDEYANNVNNVAYTTALIQRHLNETNEFNSMFGLPQNETWNIISAKMRLPVHEEAGIVMEYASMNGSAVVKQADVVLIDDLLNYKNPYSLVDLDYYANKQSADGPGMTYAAFSIVANDISPSGCSSYTYNHYSSQPYTRYPFLQYSEQMVDSVLVNGGTHAAFPFLTGMGGANRVGIFGYLGLRLFVDRLEIDPSIPPQVPSIDYRTFYWQGYAINATSNSTHTTLIRLPSNILPTANPSYAHSIPVTLRSRSKKYTLTDTPLVVPNRLLGQTLTVANNILQCKPILPNDYQTEVPGQFPLAAIDGASSTKWQPFHSRRTNYLSVDTQLSSFAPISRILFDWGNTPPAYYEVLVSNSSVGPPFDDGVGFEQEGDKGDLRGVARGRVEISEPWDPEVAMVIRRVTGNQTNVTVEGGVWSGRYVHLGIRGNLGNESAVEGGTVAEWSVVLEEGWGEKGGEGEEGGKKEGLRMWTQGGWLKGIWRW